MGENLKLKTLPQLSLPESDRWNIMNDKYALLYPTQSYRFKVVERLSIPGFPSELIPNLEGVTELKEFYGDRLLDEFIVSDGEKRDSLAFINKLNPHGLFDMMILASDHYTKSSISDLSETTGQVLLNITKGFLEFIGDKENIARFNLHDGRFHFCYNYDRDTVDRESGMAEKRFHLHLNYWTGGQLEGLPIKEFGKLTSLNWRRRLIDPGTYLGAQIAYDILGGTVAGVPLLPPDHDRDLRLGLPAGLKIQFDDWSILSDSILVKVFRELHNQLFNTYSLLSIAFCGTDSPPKAWQRNNLLPKNEVLKNIDSIAGLSETSKQGLSLLANTFRDLSPQVMEFLKRRKGARVRHLIMGGLNYSLGLYSPSINTIKSPLKNSGPVYLVVQTKLFADMGGAGISYMGDIPVVRILRGDGTFKPEHILVRREFQNSFVEFISQQLRSLQGISWEKRGITYDNYGVEV